MSTQTSHCPTRRQYPCKKTYFPINFTEPVLTTTTTEPDQPWSISDNTTTTSSHESNLHSHHSHCFLLTLTRHLRVPVTLEFNSKFVSTYAFLDMGSSCSYLQKSLQIPAHPVNIKIHPFGNNNEVFSPKTFLL